MKTCSKCLQELSLQAFGVSSNSKDGLQSRCKECYNAYHRQFYKSNSEKIKQRTAKYFAANRDELNHKRKVYRQNHLEQELATSKRWAENNRHKARAYKAKNNAKRKQAKAFSVTSKDIARVLAMNCFYCQETASEHIDHIIPLARGGTHSVGNLIGSCARCNIQKSSKTIMEYRLWKIKVLQ